MSVLPAWAPFAATIATFAVAAYIVWRVVMVIIYLRRKRLAQLVEEAVFILAYLYGLGVALKIAGIGPEFGRYHLADFGFPAMLVVLMSVLAEFYRKYDDRSTEEAAIRSDKRFVVVRLKLVPVALALSVTYEVVTGLVYAQADGQVGYIGGFDWVDVLMYFLGAAAIAGLLLYKLRLYRAYFTSLEKVKAYDSRLREIKAAMPKSPAKRYHKRKVKRGVR